MILYGASGHGKVICSVLEQLNEPIAGIFDDNSMIGVLDKYSVLGPYTTNLYANEPIIISIGDNTIRKRLSKKVQHRFGICISPSSYCDSSTKIGDGSVILQGSIIQRSTVIGKHVIVNTSASIDHDCIISDYVHISPGATLCGAVQIDEGTHIGAGSTVIQNVRIGKWCIIGAGAVVVKDIPDFSLVTGVPGREIKKLNKNE
jgi:sugar O-acyltransferase (sialic acid O-acetyltransferase NeuD family)